MYLEHCYIEDGGIAAYRSFSYEISRVASPCCKRTLKKDKVCGVVIAFNGDARQSGIFGPGAWFHNWDNKQNMLPPILPGLHYKPVADDGAVVGEIHTVVEPVLQYRVIESRPVCLDPLMATLG